MQTACDKPHVSQTTTVSRKFSTDYTLLGPNALWTVSRRSRDTAVCRSTLFKVYCKSVSILVNDNVIPSIILHTISTHSALFCTTPAESARRANRDHSGCCVPFGILLSSPGDHSVGEWGGKQSHAELDVSAVGFDERRALHTRLWAFQAAAWQSRPQYETMPQGQCIRACAAPHVSQLANRFFSLASSVGTATLGSQRRASLSNAESTRDGIRAICSRTLHTCRTTSTAASRRHCAKAAAASSA